MTQTATSTIFEHKGRDWFQINELEISVEDAYLIIHGDYGLVRDMALSRLAKALKASLDREQRELLGKLRG